MLQDKSSCLYQPMHSCCKVTGRSPPPWQRLPPSSNLPMHNSFIESYLCMLPPLPFNTACVAVANPSIHTSGAAQVLPSQPSMCTRQEGLNLAGSCAPGHGLKARAEQGTALRPPSDPAQLMQLVKSAMLAASPPGVLVAALP